MAKIYLNIEADHPEELKRIMSYLANGQAVPLVNVPPVVSETATIPDQQPTPAAAPQSEPEKPKRQRAAAKSEPKEETDTTPQQSTANPLAEKPPEEKKEITVMDVRAVLNKLAEHELQTEIKKIIEDLGGRKLSEVAPEKYDGLMAAAKTLAAEKGIAL